MGARSTDIRPGHECVEINAGNGVDGVDRARVLFFNKANESGTVLSIAAEKNQYIVANDVIINIESR